MLVDDNEMDNFFHEYVLRKTGIADHIVTLESGEAAVAYLANPSSPPIDLIFLDINMPGMSGFDFVEACQRLDRPAGQVIIVMLTSSPATEDIERANTYPEIRQYVTKPLSVEIAREIAEKYF
jgi:response regulator RpfG family c-di-GMP phosphodiesterase